MTIIDCIGRNVRFRSSFQTEGPLEEGMLVAYAERPQAVILMADGERRHVDAALVKLVEHREWVPIS
jgi:hypothetical protein